MLPLPDHRPLPLRHITFLRLRASGAVRRTLTMHAHWSLPLLHSRLYRGLQLLMGLDPSEIENPSKLVNTLPTHRFSSIYDSHPQETFHATYHTSIYNGKQVYSQSVRHARR